MKSKKISIDNKNRIRLPNKINEFLKKGIYIGNELYLVEKNHNYAICSQENFIDLHNIGFEVIDIQEIKQGNRISLTSIVDKLDLYDNKILLKPNINKIDLINPKQYNNSLIEQVKKYVPL